MTTPTTIKLPDALKKRVTREARSLGQSSHAFIVAAVERQTALARARREMFEAAVRAEKEFDDTGRHLTLDDLDRRLEAKLKGRRVRKAELKTWRKSSSPSAR
ncbi:MAG: ribbon-helix-helix protein, CopG family [Myxococcaceae bacterium]|nr:ribbon-helix-helix protein, CopG family [Myxococcaceae bacterium]